MTTDYANNEQANRRRDEKAKALARVLYDEGWSASAAADFTAPDRNETARTAGVNPPSTLTWDRVVELLARRHQYDADRELPTPALPATAPPPPRGPGAQCTTDGCPATEVIRYPVGPYCQPCSPGARYQREREEAQQNAPA